MAQGSNQTGLLILHKVLFCFFSSSTKELESGLKAQMRVLMEIKNLYLLSSILYVITVLGQLHLLKA